MKTIPKIILFLVLIPKLTYAQDKIDKEIIETSCNCIKKINIDIDKQAKNDSIKSCISSSIILNQTTTMLKQLNKGIDVSEINQKDTIKLKSVNFTIYAEKDYDKIQKQLLEDCSFLKRLLMSNNMVNENSYSDKKKALEFYKEGQIYSEKEQYDLALVAYNKAIKKDSKFAFAWDNMGMCYRKLKRYKEAINCYEESLKIDPKGAMPLLNKAVAYDYLEDYKKAADAYLSYIKMFPDDPEGFYGAGRAFFSNEEYEKGLDNLFQSYLLYKKTNSPYIHDAESNISLFYKDLKEKGKLDVFEKSAKKYNIQIN